MSHDTCETYLQHKGKAEVLPPPSIEGFFKYRRGWALLEILNQLFWAGALESWKVSPRHLILMHSPRKNCLRMIWLKILRMPKSRQIGRRPLKRSQTQKRLALSNAYGLP